MSRIDFLKNFKNNVNPVETVFIFNDRFSNIDELISHIKDVNIVIVDSPEKADAIISYGGDGTLLGSIHRYPDKQILPIRRLNEFTPCSIHGVNSVLSKLREGFQLNTTILDVIETYTLGDNEEYSNHLFAVNDITVRQNDPRSALRFIVRHLDPNSGKEIYSQELIGDGVVMTTPFGSSGYYRAITKSVIRSGFGLAFNNSTEAVDHQVFGNDFLIEIVPTRGSSIVIADNQISKNIVGSIRITNSKQCRTIIGLDSLVCNKCACTNTGKPLGFRHV